MTTAVSHAYLARVEAALSDAGAKPAAIHAIAGGGSLYTTRHALRELVEAGRCRFKGPPTRRLYFVAKSEAES